MPSPNLTISSIGSRAHQLLAQSQSASVWGSTSQGIFLHLPPRGIIFLSFETHHGPLTANLESDFACLRRVNRSEVVQIGGERLYFSGSGNTLGWRDAAIWDVLPLPQVPLHIGEVQERYQQVYCLVTTRRPTSINLSLRAERSNLVPDDLLQTLLPLLGQGEGLTPAGDDVVLGCLLALCRWGDRLALGWDFQMLSQELVAAAFIQTTLLSANLIECAADGQADERLVQALDGIFTGQLSAEGCAELLLNWGHSSGVEALRGMGIMLKLVRETTRACCVPLIKC